MKINNKGYASTIILFSILTLFLISMLMLVKIMSNSSTLNKKITEKVVDNINYDASGTVQDQIAELNTTITSMQNQINNIKGEVINEIYPVGSIYMSEKDDTIEKVQSKFGGTWEKVTDRFLVGASTSYPVSTVGGSKIHSHKYGIQYGGYFGMVLLESNSNAGILNFSESNSISISYVNSTYTFSGMANTSTQSSYNDIGSAYYRLIGQSEYVSSLPPYYSVYIYRRTN